jgi:pimeloyl-ACP methyl ester carboxylesterase
MPSPSSDRRALGTRTARRAAGLMGVSAAVAWELQRRADRRRILADPAHAVLNAPLSGRRIPVRSADGAAIHAEAFGPEGGPTVVLVHGWTCSLRFWTHQIRTLSDELRVVAYDLRGHGRSVAPAAPRYSIDAFAADLGAVLQACVPAGERAVVAGHSLGAMCLIAWAGAHRDRVERDLAAAALVNTGLGDLIAEALVLRAPQRLARARQVAGRALLGAKAPIPKGTTPLSHRAIRYVALSRSASPAAVAFCERLVLECRRDVRAACGRTLSRLDLRESVQGLGVPTAVIAGARDKLTPPVHARRLAGELPELIDYVEVADAGHMIPVERPEEVSRRLRQLARASLATPRSSPSVRARCR